MYLLVCTWFGAFFFFRGLVWFWFFETGFYSVVHADLGLETFLPQCPWDWDYQQALAHLASLLHFFFT